MAAHTMQMQKLHYFVVSIAFVQRYSISVQIDCKFIYMKSR